MVSSCWGSEGFCRHESIREVSIWISISLASTPSHPSPSLPRGVIPSLPLPLRMMMTHPLQKPLIPPPNLHPNPPLLPLPNQMCTLPPPFHPLPSSLLLNLILTLWLILLNKHTEFPNRSSPWINFQNFITTLLLFVPSS